MSIYMTIRTGRVNGHEVFVQAVPAHIDHTGPEWDWLGPPAKTREGIRTVFIVELGTPKGTERNGQELHHWLLHLSWHEYFGTPWPELRKRIAKALKEQVTP